MQFYFIIAEILCFHNAICPHRRFRLDCAFPFLILLHLLRHKLFHALAFRTGVVVAVTFQQVDDTPDAETSAQSDNEGLKNGDSLIEKCHKL